MTRTLHTIRTLVCSVLIVAATPSGARATVIYENPWNSLAVDAGAFSQFSQQLAGEFSLAVDANANRATWYGTMFKAMR